MSLKTWKKEFYPKSAKVIAALVDKNTTEGAIELVKHSLRKWEGARDAALDKHDLDRGDAEIIGDARDFQFDSSTCSLCRAYYDKSANAEVTESECVACPIPAKNKGKTCNTQWLAFRNIEDPEPMITLLTLVLEQLEQDLNPSSEVSDGN